MVAGLDPHPTQTSSRDSMDAMNTPENGIYYLEIVAADAETARDFYGALYGWHFEDAAAELGNAFVAEIPGGSLCGIRASMHELEKPVVRAYMRVTNLKASVEQAEKLGATIALPHMAIPGRGEIAVYTHGGVEQGLWQVG
ncbi:MAG: hydroxylase [Planctomycetota bacterium]|nr:hydroxylase [Planctomycetota bacterium]